MSKKVLTPDELNYIQQYCKSKTIEQLAQELDISEYMVRMSLYYLGISNNYKQPWTKNEDLYLKEHFEIESRETIAENLNKCIDDIRARIFALKLRIPGEVRYKYKGTRVKYSWMWTNDEIEYLKKEYDRLAYKDIAENLNCNVHAVEVMAKKLGLKKHKKIARNTFNYYDEEIIKNFYGKIADEKIAEMMNNKWSINAIRKKAQELGVKKPKLTVPERQVEDILKTHDISFEAQKRIYFGKKYFICDFVVNNFVIEVQGDFWHANPRIYAKKKLLAVQKKNINNDQVKKEKLESIGYKVIYVWEYDLKNHRNETEKQLIATLKLR